MRKVGLFISALTFLSSAYSQQLIINEVSQGTGTAEYVEFVVIGSPICSGTVPTIDLRKVMIDDNNGFFAGGGGSGIANGALRFSNDAFWSAVPQGTFILVYNHANKNASIPDDDISLSDNNCTLIIPGNSPLLESTTVSPNSSDISYPPDASWGPSIGWSVVQMQNSDDSFQIPLLGGGGTPLHAVSWGNNTSGAIISFPGSAAGRVFSFQNSVSNDWNDQANWVSDPVASGQTPGAANNAANDYWIGTMNPNCRSNPLFSFTTTESACGAANGSATLNLSGISSSTIVWEDGQTGATASNLAAGVYSVLITDNTTGCIYVDSTIINNAGAALLAANFTDETCVDACNGTATVNTTGGTSPLQFQWDFAAGAATTATVSNLCPGTYGCIVTDANNCQSNILVTISEAVPITITTSATDATCGNSDGSATVTITGGAGPLNILWDGNAANQTTATAINLASGIYTVGIVDALSCIYTATAIVNDAGAPTATISSTPVSCTTPCSGTASVSATGGTGTLTYLWNAAALSQTTPAVSNLCAGTYSCEVTDANGCSATVLTTIAPAGAISLVSVAQNESCTGTCDGNIAFQVNDASGATIVTLTEGFNPPQTISASPITGLCSGSYTLNVSDASGCSTASTLIVSTDLNLDYSISNDTVICTGASAQLLVRGTGLSNILWSNASTNDTIQVTPTSTTPFTVNFDQSGCSVQLSVIVGVIDCLLPIDQQLILPNIITVNGDGLNDAFVPVFMSNGIDVTSFTILNRWGNVMYESDKDVIFWDGKAANGDFASDGNYFYILTYIMAGQEPVTKHGFFQLVTGKK